MNMFAGMCSKPMTTKAEIGNQMPTTLIASCTVRPSFISQYLISSAKITPPSQFPIPETAKVLGMLI